MTKLRYPIAECKFSYATPINTKGVPDEWAKAIMLIEKDISRFSPSESPEYKIRSFLGGRYTQSLKWLIKEKWMPRLNVEVLRAGLNNQFDRELGQYFRAVLELCERCHSFESEYSKLYKNSSEWLLSIVLEKFEADIKECYNPLPIKEGNKLIQDAITTIKHGHTERGRINPFDPETMPHLSRLIECSIKLLSQNKTAWDVFMVGDAKDRKIQRINGLGFLRTYQKLKITTNQNRLPAGTQFGILAVEAGQAILRQGNRKAKTFPEIQRISSSKLKPMQGKGFTTYTPKKI